MTGCDLRYNAEEMRGRVCDRFDDLSNRLGIAVSDEAAGLGATAAKLAALAATLAEVAEAVARVARWLTADQEQCASFREASYQDITGTLNEVREYFHEAVDQRVENGGYMDEDDVENAKEEAAREAREQLISEVRDAVSSAIDGCE